LLIAVHDDVYAFDINPVVHMLSRTSRNAAAIVLMTGALGARLVNTLLGLGGGGRGDSSFAGWLPFLTTGLSPCRSRAFTTARTAAAEGVADSSEEHGHAERELVRTSKRIPREMPKKHAYLSEHHSGY
jgi:hypothetical protein